jgi:hypothetical protein
MADDNKTKRIEVLIESISPMLMNPATEEVLSQLPGAGAGYKKGKEMKDRTREEIAESRVIRGPGPDGKLVPGIPAEYLYACLIEAGRMVQYDGKAKVSTVDKTLVFAFLSIEQSFFPFEGHDGTYAIDVRRGVNKTTKGAQAIVRPRFDQWKFRVTLEVDESDSNLTASKAKELFNKAGKLIGLADFRPTCRGPFGRFRIAEWKELPMAA